MSKNWLIRTKSNHILGPISKEKALELLQNGSIKPDDEVCSGNGFWFFIREDEMVSRFLLGREIQTFNPISEAKDILTSPPRPGVQEEDITMVGGFDLNKLKGEKEKTPPAGTYVSQLPVAEVKAPSAPEPKKKVEVAAPTPKPKPAKVTKASVPKAPLKKQNYLQYLALLCFAIILAALLYRKAIFRYFKGADISLIESVHAQEIAPAEKKK